MSNLLKYRVNASCPFIYRGIDYAGPYHLICSKNRGQKTLKGYISVFVCMASKATHLKAASVLTSDAFSAALKRFISRRGKCTYIYSDNGTNFVVPARKLDEEFLKFIKHKSRVSKIKNDKILWQLVFGKQVLNPINII